MRFDIFSKSNQFSLGGSNRPQQNRPFWGVAAMPKGKRVGGRTRNYQSTLLRKLELLCDAGMGLPAMASEFCRICCELGGFDGAFLMWFAADETPQGFYHSNAPAELKDMFVREFDAKFFAGEAISSLSLARPGGAVIGRMMAPGMQERFRQGNIHRLLCAPLGHGEMLDISAAAADGSFAGIALWLREGERLTAEHVERLRPVQPLMARAIAGRGDATRWRAISDGAPHFLTCDHGENLLAIDPAAERILMCSQLLRQQVAPGGPPSKPPGFVRGLRAQLAVAGTARIDMPVADGRLVCDAVATRMLRGANDCGAPAILCLLKLEQAEDVIRVNRLMNLALTPLQRRIALFAMRGGRRQDCNVRFAVSDEALKKHVRAILQTLDCARWSDLAVVG